MGLVAKRLPANIIEFWKIRRRYSGFHDYVDNYDDDNCDDDNGDQD